jgi:hypothetical protein
MLQMIVVISLWSLFFTALYFRREKNNWKRATQQAVERLNHLQKQKEVLEDKNLTLVKFLRAFQQNDVEQEKVYDN